jgi:FMN-dependent NADH-azoreductase
MKILQINAGARREGANATRPANQTVSGLRALDPSVRVTVRDLAVSPSALRPRRGGARLPVRARRMTREDIP